MSKVVDERVVEMRFDNSNFEKNVQGTLSTLDKFKHKLNMDGAAKGLDAVGKAAKSVDMTPMARGLETVQAKFSALEVIGVTALANLTNSVLNAGKKLLSSLFIEPKSDGFKEYELMLNSIQTTMAGTGKTAKEVEAELKKLDDYADKTVYSTADMLNNLPKFTNAGVELEVATKAMIGIANATALAGGDANKASIAFYNLGQSIGTGYLSRMDYNSINNAGIATMEWKNQMVEAALAQKTLTKVGEDSYKAGTKTYTLQQLFIDGLQEQWATTDVMLEVLGNYGSETTDVGKKAYAAAQNIKTYTQMMESLKATAGTGWKDTWQIIFGDLDGATKLWTSLSNAIGSVIESTADFRNTVLKIAFGKNFIDLFNKVQGAFGGISDVTQKAGKAIGDLLSPINKTADGVSKAVDGLLSYSELVDQIIAGQWDNGQPRWDALTKAGYDWAHAQNLVNEKLGCSVRYTTDYKEAQENLNDSQKDGAAAQSELSEAEAKRLADLAKMSDAELKAAGYTKEQIDLLRKLQKEASKTGYSFEEFIKNIDKINGRSLLIDSFANIGNSMLAIFGAIKDAWAEIFEITPEGLGQSLYDLIAGFHKLTSYFKVNEEAAGKLKRTFKGVFAILDVILTVVGGPIKIAFKILSQLLGACNIDILDFTARIGDALVGFRDWVDGVLDFTGVFDKIITPMKNGIAAIKAWIASLKESENLPRDIAQGIVNGLGAAISFVKNIISQLVSYVTGGFSQLPGFMSSGFVGGIWNVIQTIGQTMVELGNIIIEKIKGVLGIHSPSTVFFAIGGFIIAGLIAGLTAGWDKVGAFISGLGSKLAEMFANVDIGSIISATVSVGTLVMIGKIVSSVTSPLEQFGDVLDSVADIIQTARGTVRAFTGVLRSFSMSIKAEAIKNIAISLAILVGAVAILTMLDTAKVWMSVGVLLALGGILVVLSAAINKFGTAKVASVAKFTFVIFTISTALLVLAGVLRIIGGMEWGELGVAAAGVALLGAFIGGLIFLTKKFGANLAKVGPAILQLSLAMILLTITLKLLAGMEWSELGTAAVGIALLGAFIGGLMFLTKKFGANLAKVGPLMLQLSAAVIILAIAMRMLGGMEWHELAIASIGIALLGAFMGGLMILTKKYGAKLARVGPLMLQLSSAMLILAIAMRILGGLEWGELAIATLGMAVLGAFIGGLIWLVKKYGSGISKVGATLVQLSASILILSIALRILGGISWGGLAKAYIGMVLLAGVVAALIYATSFAGPNDLKRVGTTLLMFSFAIAILAGVCMVLGMLSVPALLKGVAAVSVLAYMMSIMVKATKDTQNAKSTILAMSVAIAVMAASVAALSFIKTDKLKAATVALSMVMGMFALIAKCAGTAAKSVGVLAVMTVAIGLITVCLCKLASLPTESVMSSAIALSTLLLSLSISLKILSNMNTSVGSALTGVLALTLMYIPLMALVGVLAAAQNIQNAASNALLLSTLATAMILLLIPLTAIGTLGTSGAPYLGVLALLAMAVPLLAFVGVLALMENLQNAITNAEALIKLMSAMTAMLVVLAVVGPLALVGVQAMVAFELLMVATGAMVIAIGALMEKFPALEAFMNSGLETLKSLALGIGEIISAFGVGLTSGMPQIGANLSGFMTNLSGFIAGANSISGDLAGKIAALSGAIVLLTAADLIAGISSFLQNGSSFAQLGADLSAFMISAMPFITGLSAVNPDSLTGVKALVEAILILTAADLISGLTSWFTGGVSLAEFGAELAAFGPYMAQYASAVAGIDAAAVEASAKAAKGLAEMANALPNSGGVVGWFMGENDMDTFGAQLYSFGTALKNYGASVTGLAVEPIMASVEAGKALADMADVVPNLGGVVGWFCGDNDLATFGTQITSFGNSLKAYSLTVTGLTIEPITQSVEAGKALAGLNDAIPNLGGMVAWFTGDNDLATFGTKIVSFGSSLVAYSTAVTGLNVGAITLSIIAAQQLAKLAQALPSDGGFWSLFKDDKINFETFGKEIKKLGEGMQGYSVQVASLNAAAVTASISSARQLVSLIKTMGGLDASGVATFSEAIGKLGKASVDKFVEAFTTSTSTLNTAGSNLIKAVATGAESAKGNLTTTVNNTVKSMTSAFTSKLSAFKTIGAKLMTAFITGINKSKSKVKTAMTKAAESGVTGARSKYTEFYKAGSYAVSGFVKGIDDNRYRATAAGTRLGKAAYTAAKRAIDSNSPSKKFMELGMYADQGLANGIMTYAYLATRASTNLGNGIIGSMQKELKINSPSKVARDEVGNYIVQGISEGIKKDMSAEEAAEQKASNIVNAFSKELEKHDTDMATVDLLNELWELENPWASESEKAAKKVEAANARMASQTEKVTLAQAEYNITCKEFGENSEEAQKAANKLLEERIALEKELVSVQEIQAEAAEREKEAKLEYFEVEKEKHSADIDTTDLELELWETKNPLATDSEKITKSMETISERIISQNEKAYLAHEKYLTAVNEYGEDSKEAQEAYNEALEEEIALEKEKADLLQIQKEAKLSYFENEQSKHDAAIETADLEYDLWLKRNKTASATEKIAKETEVITSRIASQNEVTYLAHQKYLTAVNEYGADSKEAQEAYNAWLEEQIALEEETATLLETRKKDVQNSMDAVDAELDTYDKNHELWVSQNESASAAEKTAQEAALIYSRIASQTEKVSLAQEEYTLAVEEYGKDSIEAQTAYNKWLDEQIALNGETKALLELRNKAIEHANESADLDMSITDLEKEIWDSNNSSAKDAAKSSKDLDTILDKLPEQAKKVGLAQATWEAAKERYGEDSNEAKTAYKEYLEAKRDMASLTSESGTVYDEALMQNRKAQKLYFELLKENTEDFRQMGMSMEEIEAWAREQSGYNPSELRRLMGMNIDDTAAEAMGIVESTYDEYANMTFEELSAKGAEYGEEYSESISEGVKEAAPGAKDAVQTVVDASVDGVSACSSALLDAGKQIVVKLAEGITASVDSITHATDGIVTSILEAVANTVVNSEDYIAHPVISPVLNLSEFQNGVGIANGLLAANTAMLAEVNVKLTNDSLALIGDSADEFRRMYESKQADTISAIKSIKEDIVTLGDMINGMQVTLDGKAVVGGLINSIDSSLGQIVNHKGRGN